jgi:hypothetical protein
MYLPVKAIFSSATRRTGPGLLCVQPLKKLKTDENALLTLLYRWRDEAVRSGHKISRIAFEAGRDGLASALAQSTLALRRM